MASDVSLLLWPRVAAPPIPSAAGYSCQRSYGPRLPTISRRCAGVRPANYVRAFVTVLGVALLSRAESRRLSDGISKSLTNEYRAIPEAGHVLQIDAPDLAMERSRYR